MFTNLDAQWLSELAEAFDGEPEAARLRLIAERLQRFDDASRTYDDGVADERRRWLARSNIPGARAIDGEALAKAIAATPVKRALPRPKASRPSRVSVEGIVIDLSKLGL